ncbi:MAG: T9SS type A sorting domain-containing protein [Bacteroidota bacterium]
MLFYIVQAQASHPSHISPPHDHNATIHSLAVDTSLHHYEYVFTDGWMNVYNIDSGFVPVKSISVPTSQGTRGIAASPKDGMLYISYRGDGGYRGNGSLLQYNLLNDSIVWTRNYLHGVDSHEISRDGKTIYMPDGELTPDGTWYLVNTVDGSEKSVSISTSTLGPHNTIVSLDGSRVYLGDRDPTNVGNDYFYVVNIANDSIIQKVGPMKRGIRPFTVNANGTIAYIAVTGLLGFQVGDLTTGKVLYTIDLTTMGYAVNPYFTDGFPGGNVQTSHGISLSPDEKKLYLIDSPNSIVHVFDVSGVENNIAPVKLTDVHLLHPLLGSATGCAYDCLQIGWLQHSLDGKYVFVGDCGDVISTSNDSIVAFIPTLRNSRKMMEIDWQGGRPIMCSTRQGLGYAVTPVAPEIPSLSSVTAPGSTNIILSWDWEQTATSYHVQVSTDSLFSALMVDDSSNVDTSAQLQPLAGSTSYYWHVQSVNKYRSSPWSVTWSFTTNPGGGLPIQLNMFTGITDSLNRIILNWTTVSEVNNYGFEVQRSADGKQFQTLPNSFIPGHGTTLESNSYSFTDQTAGSGKWYYRLKQIDLDGTFSYGFVIQVVAGALSVKDLTVPHQYVLHQNYPNPFNPATKIQFELPARSVVRLAIYNILGQVVATLVDGTEDAGVQEIQWNAGNTSSGIYFYKLEATSASDPVKSFVQVRKLILLK